MIVRLGNVLGGLGLICGIGLYLFMVYDPSYVPARDGVFALVAAVVPILIGTTLRYIFSGGKSR
jgi:hypothetical protein